jgi:hypothetical protein
LIALCFKLRGREPRLDLRAKLVGMSIGIRLGVGGVSVEHEHCDTPDIDIWYHAGKLIQIELLSF